MEMWITMKCTIYVLVVLIASAKASTKDDDHYIAGVVEFRPAVDRNTSAHDVTENLAAYLEIINSSEANATDVLVFPEDALNDETEPTTVPDPTKELVAPCDDSSPQRFQKFLVKLSCAARTTRKYILINLAEKVPCPDPGYDKRPCAPSGLNIYNTNVVFDRDGRVISRYRKIHLFNEPLRNTTLVPELGVFDTDFGVRFGHFVCFDILFYWPSQELVKKSNTTDFLFPSYWVSELPFLTSLQTQQSWAWGNNVNVLAAGASAPETGATGTGIFTGNRGEITALFASGPGERKLLVAKVSKILSKNETNIEWNQNSQNSTAVRSKNLKLTRDPNIERFNSYVITFNATQNQTQNLSRLICANGQCCQFEVSLRPLAPVQDHSHYTYRMGVFSGQRHTNPDLYLKVCGVYACLNESITSCGYLLPDNVDYSPSVVFESIHIQGGFSKYDKLLIMPNTLTDTFHGLSPRQMEFKINEQSENMAVTLNLTSEVDNLLTFGIYAKYYDKSAAKGRDNSVTLLMCSLFIVFVRFSNLLHKGM